MSTRTITRAIALVALTAATVLSGCQSKQPVPRTEPEPTTTVQSGWPTRTSDANWLWSGMAYPTGVARTSAIGVEKGVPREARLGGTVEYIIVVTNLTGNVLEDVVVTDEPSNTFKFVKSTPDRIASTSGLTWALGELKGRESKTITVTGTAAGEGTITSCVSVTYSSLLCSAIPVVSPKLKLTKTGPAEVLKCEEIVYTMEVTNTGTGSIPNVKVTDTLPAGLKTADGKNVAEFAVGALGAGQSRKLTVRAMADKAGKFENKAVASADGMTAESGLVATVVKQPVLTITRKCPGQQYVGRVLDYEITVTNTGDGVARDTVVEDTIPTGTTFSAASDGGRPAGNRVVWNLGTLEPKATKTVKYSAMPGGSGTFSGTATARAFCAEAVSASCSSAVTGIPAILLEVVDIEDPVKVGDNNTYIITVTNQGSAPGTNIKLVVTLEGNQQHISSTGPTAATASGSTVTFAPIPSLAAKERATYRVTVKNVKAGDVRFKTTMTSDQLSRAVEETEATNVYE